MLVGWGGNNGSTLTAAIEANRRQLEWRTKTGPQKANWYGSITQASTVLLGSDANGSDVYIPMNKLLPMANPDEMGKRKKMCLTSKTDSQTVFFQFSTVGTLAP